MWEDCIQKWLAWGSWRDTSLPMAYYSVTLSGPASESLDRVQGKLMTSWKSGTGIGWWQPSKAKTIELLCWVYEQLCEHRKLEVADLMKFQPVTAPQGRRKFQPTLHQISVATKLLVDMHKREPTPEEVTAFLKRNPDVGWCPNIDRNDL